MIRLLTILMLFCAPPIAAQDFSAFARVDAAGSRVMDDGNGLVVDLQLSQAVPYRVFTLDDPRRLVVDFREVDWTGLDPATFNTATLADDLRFGVLRPGWSRLVVDLAAPLLTDAAGMQVDTNSGAAHLTIRMSPSDAATFSAKSGAPADPEWGALMAVDATLPPPTPDDGPLTVVIDPGHGGIDPGALRDNVQEAALMLQLGIEVAEALNRAGGVRAILTRDADIFVPLEQRMTIARAVNADLFISLHADALEEDEAKGGSVYTLNAEGSDRASQRMAERHERGDLLAGLDLSGHDDRIATVLMDLARLESAPKSQRFADTLVAQLRASGATLNSRSRRAGRLAVLNAADFPSVLIEVGFLSNAQDRAALQSRDERAKIVQGIVQAVQIWATDEAVHDALVRQ